VNRAASVGDASSFAGVASVDRLDALEARIGVTFTDRDTLLRSLAHRSWCSENGEPESNERLEFLGESVLGLVVTHYVFEHFPTLPEGQLSEVRAGVVNARVLAELAAELDLGAHLLLGKGEDAAGGRAKQSILADAFEAVVAAVYLDQGFAVARDLILRCLSERIADAAAGPGGRDYKTRLQEATAARSLGRPRYVVRDEGPDHAKHFFATVHLNDRLYGEGEGRSKKQAEQSAAWAAFARLHDETDGQGGDHAGAT
jgi:ribonuclease-3